MVEEAGMGIVALALEAAIAVWSSQEASVRAGVWLALQAEQSERQQLEVIEAGVVVSSVLAVAQGVPSASAVSSGC